MSRTWPSLVAEFEWRDRGCRLIAGLDEAGRGAWAGPVVAGAIVLPLDDPALANRLDGVCDSKMLSAAERERWEPTICSVALAVGVGLAGPDVIDSHGIVPATRQAMSLALAQLNLTPDAVLIDALRLPGCRLPQQAIIHGDVLSLSIAAASIVAKVARDRLMAEFDRVHPGYGFARHKGYGTPQHRSALEALGPSPIHRLSFAPVARRLSTEAESDRPAASVGSDR
jgi:ribonuclease HII